MTTNEPVLSATHLRHSYVGHLVLDGVSFDILPGEIHALIGHNGAGKSTLAACISGQLTPGQGNITTRGAVALVTQHPQVIPDKPVAASVWLGREPKGRWGTSQRAAIEATTALAARVGLDLETLGIDPSQLGGTLSATQRQFVALLAALSKNPAVLIVDEVTAGGSQVDRFHLVDALETIVKTGVGVVMITHHGDEVVRVAGRVTVLHQGNAHGPLLPPFSLNTIRAAMAGNLGNAGESKGTQLTAVSDAYLERASTSGTNGLTVTSPTGHQLHISPGTVGVILGAPADGITALTNAITGLHAAPNWHVVINGEPVTNKDLAQRRKAGLGWVVGDRTTLGPAPGLTIAENLAMASPGTPIWVSGIKRTSALQASTTMALNAFPSLNTLTPNRKVQTCSGGQAQAVMVARELAANPKVLLLNDPAHGLDPGAMADLVAQLNTAASQGMTILITTNDPILAGMVGTQHWRATHGEFEPIPQPAPSSPVNPPKPGVGSTQQRITLPGPLLAVVFALALAAGVIGAWGANPVTATQELLTFAWFTPAGMSATLAHLVPLLVIGAGVAVMFRADVISIGAEGQLYIGALTGAIVAQHLIGTGLVTALLALLSAALAGALWALPAAWLKARWGANEIVATLILNGLGLLVCAWLVAGPLKGKTGSLTTAPVLAEVRLTHQLFGPITLDVCLALGVLAVTSWVLAQTRWGLATRYLGTGEARAQVMGIDPPTRQIQVLLIGGALAGLAGALVVLGPAGGRFNYVFSPGYGFMAITVALIGAYRGWGMLIAGIAYATLMAGAGVLQLSAGIPLAITGLIQGVLVLAVTLRISLSIRHTPSPSTIGEEAS